MSSVNSYHFIIPLLTPVLGSCNNETVFVFWECFISNFYSPMQCYIYWERVGGMPATLRREPGMETFHIRHRALYGMRPLGPPSGEESMLHTTRRMPLELFSIFTSSKHRFFSREQLNLTAFRLDCYQKLLRGVRFDD